MEYAKGGVLPGYQNPIPTQDNIAVKRSSRNTQTQYTSIGEVVRLYKAGILSYGEAYTILRNQFGLSDNDINDVFEEIQPIGPPEPPETEPDPIPEPEPEPESQGGTETADSGIKLTDDQRFLLIGLLVIGIGSRIIMKSD